MSVVLPLTFFFFFNDTATTEIYTLSLHDALPISRSRLPEVIGRQIDLDRCDAHPRIVGIERVEHQVEEPLGIFEMAAPGSEVPANQAQGEVRLFDSQSEQALRLLLWRQV